MCNNVAVQVRGLKALRVARVIGMLFVATLEWFILYYVIIDWSA